MARTRKDGLEYISVATMGTCKVCRVYQDLRCGCCFKCAYFVAGKNHGNGIHELWDSRNPENRWYVIEKSEPCSEEGRGDE